MSNGISLAISQPAITYSKVIIEILEQGVKYVQVNNKDTRTTQMASFLVSL